MLFVLLSLYGKSDQQPEQEWSRIRSLTFFVGAGMEPEPRFCQNTVAGVGV